MINISVGPNGGDGRYADTVSADGADVKDALLKALIEVDRRIDALLAVRRQILADLA